MTNPDKLFMDKADRKLYEELAQNSEALKRRNRRDQFFYAMCLGFKNGVSRPLSSREALFNAWDLRPEDEALMDAVAIHETGSTDVLTDRVRVFKIAEEYAHAGIRILHRYRWFGRAIPEGLTCSTTESASLSPVTMLSARRP